ncbi:MAG: hypothetical protein FWC40_01410 [Proteobacteria bacterium]|nr:hypothetical protein [Pseudomonadota bacterium]
MKKTAILVAVLVSLVGTLGCGEDKDTACNAYTYSCVEGKKFFCDNGVQKEISEFPVINGVSYTCDFSQPQSWAPGVTNQCDGNMVIAADDGERYIALCDANDTVVECKDNVVTMGARGCKTCNVETFGLVCDELGNVASCKGKADGHGIQYSHNKKYELDNVLYGCTWYTEYSQIEPLNACDGDFIVGQDNKRYTSLCGVKRSSGLGGEIQCRDGKVAQYTTPCIKNEVVTCDIKTFEISCSRFMPTFDSSKRDFLAFCVDGEVVYNDDTMSDGEYRIYNDVWYTCAGGNHEYMVFNHCKDGKVQKGVDGEYIDFLCGVRGKVVCEEGNSRATETDEPCE